MYLLKYYYKIIIKKKSSFKFSYEKIVVGEFRDESRASSANERESNKESAIARNQHDQLNYYQPDSLFLFTRRTAQFFLIKTMIK